MTTKQQRAVETIEEFKLRIAGIIRGKVQEIPSSPPHEPATGPPKEASLCTTFTKFAQEKTSAALI
ncbi:MAG: hypothetical protein ACM3NN_04730 [Nitrospirota bacterium]